MAAAVQTPFAAATAAAAAPHQIIMIPQNLLSEQSKSFLKQRLVLPSNYKPVAAVVGSKRAIPPITATRAAATIPATKMAVSGLKRPLSPTTKSPTINNSGPTPAKRVFDIESIKEEILVEEEEEEEAGLFSAHQQTAARKRTNLDHLSPEERLMRRKLKNRVAAQTARDKKKQYIDEMEAMLTKIKSERRQLMEENRRLQESNADLQLENTALLQKNQELEARLGIPSSVTNLSVLPDPIDPAALPLSPLSMPRSPSPVLSASSPVVPVVSPTPDIVTADASPMSAASSPTLTEPAVLVPLPQEGVGSEPPDPGLSSSDLTTWSRSSVLARTLMLSAATVMASAMSTATQPSQSPSLTTASTPSNSNTSETSTSETLMPPSLPPKKRCTWSAPPLPPPPPLMSPPLG